MAKFFTHHHHPSHPLKTFSFWTHNPSRKNEAQGGACLLQHETPPARFDPSRSPRNRPKIELLVFSRSSIHADTKTRDFIFHNAQNRSVSGDTIIHYATSNITPQQTLNEISIPARVLEKRSPCNFLVFGLGHDSLMWSALNHGGRTVFLEEDRAWMEKIGERFPDLESYHAVYKTKVREADELLKLRSEKECTEVGDARYSKCPLSLMDLPAVFYETEWDLIMVDAPTGYFADAPGRMGATYTAGMVARARRQGETDVFVHDVDRVVEDEFSIAFLCKEYLKEQEGMIRHFAIPSHRSAKDLSFCP